MSSQEGGRGHSWFSLHVKLWALKQRRVPPLASRGWALVSLSTAEGIGVSMPLAVAPLLPQAAVTAWDGVQEGQRGGSVGTGRCSPVMRQPYSSSLRAMPLCQLWGRMRTKRVSTGLWILLRTTSVASSLA